jgi:hypothetical protein
LDLSSRLRDTSGPNTDPITSSGLLKFGTNLTSLLDFSCFGSGFRLALNFTLNATGIPSFPMPMLINPAFVDYSNDNRYVTTLNHVLNSAAIVKNATVRDVIDIRGNFVSAEYL